MPRPGLFHRAGPGKGIRHHDRGRMAKHLAEDFHFRRHFGLDQRLGMLGGGQLPRIDPAALEPVRQQFAVLVATCEPVTDRGLARRDITHHSGHEMLHPVQLRGEHTIADALPDLFEDWRIRRIVEQPAGIDEICTRARL
jgi:hypothetical protein